MRRRSFLKLLAGAAAGAVLPVPAARASVERVPVPPTVMLHARQAHLDNLPRLLDWLAERNYTPITYRALWDHLSGSRSLPARPAIITIDDLTLVRGSSNFAFIARMIDVLLERAVPAVVGIITEPIVTCDDGRLVQLKEQDDALWGCAAVWQASGIELATHTTSHRNLAEVGITPDVLRHEIGASAALIAARTGQPVGTLILPFGNGASDSHAGRLRAPIAEVCRACGIGIVAGVGGGRAALEPAPPDAQPIYFVGRVGPAADAYDGIFWEITHWHR
ncbi:MAG TPA: polysaccharide deacetylase family protein [Aggregatilineaceae bacterium]|nr:polysaccharide deacetylase family protein [Aggregatilineaceae bacterium]